MQNRVVQFHKLGLIPYEEALELQKSLFDQTVQLKIANRKEPENEQPTENHLLFCQHPHTYTLGKSGSKDNLLIADKDLEAKGATFHPIGRGGDITYHGPGQLVGYPILDLDNFFTDIHKYLRFLEEAIILTCGDYGIEAGRIDGLTGVWIDHIEQKNPRKICAFGVKASRWVTMHGFAFNVSTDLNYFGNIVPCGITDKDVTSLERELGQAPSMEEVEEKVKGHLAQLFEMTLEESKTYQP